MLLLAKPAHAVETVVHGDFETRDPFIWTTNYTDMIGTWNAPGTTGSSLSLAQGGIAGSYAFQTLDLSAYGSATLSFDLTAVAHGAPGTSYLAVTLGYDNEVARYSFGSATDGETTTKHVSIPLTNRTGFLPNSPLLFMGAHQNGSHTGIWVDNVSIQAQPVPEPTTLAALGLGALAAFRRRRRA